MLYLTQLLYVNPGKEAVLDAFESVMVPLVSKHGGQFLLRLRPNADSVVAADIEVPYELHLVRFNSNEALTAFLQDPERQRLLHLKNEAVRDSLLVSGSA